MVIELAGSTEPTERSSCPAIISRPTGRAMMPSSAATLSQLAAPPADRKLAPPKIEKKTKTAMMPISEPISGRRTRPPSEVPEWAGSDVVAALGGWTNASDFIEGSSALEHGKSAPTEVYRQRDGESGPGMHPRAGHPAKGASGRRPPRRRASASTLAASTIPGPVRTGLVGRSSP